ncbi:MAG TPA: hypothetical protein VK487_11965 [Candidatus Bathyarchaeia archaeon]|nr:hypothetical protein [Candidatus Bathyarchaeia archaeon]
MKSIKVGKLAIPVWLIAVILISGIGMTMGTYIWTTLTIPFGVKEPLEVLNYPSQLSLYAGESLRFNITLMNYAAANYSVALSFLLNNATYQSDYVTFSNYTYFIVPNVQNVTAWVTVAPDAPPASFSLTISFARFAPTLPPPLESLSMSNLRVWFNTTSPGWAEAAFTLVNTGSSDVVLQSITARSQPSAWSNVYYLATKTSTITALSPTTTQPTGASITPIINGTYQTLNRANGTITLKSGYTLVVYINHPDSVGQNDVGTPVDVTVFTANAQWTQEVNVQAVG